MLPPSPSATTTSRGSVSTDSISAPLTSCACGAAAKRIGKNGAQQRVLDDVAEIGLADVGAVEVERARRVSVRAFPDAHAPIGCGARLRHSLPHADVLEQLLRRARQRVDARVHVLGAPTRASARVENDHAQTVGAAARREQCRGREPDDACAGNEYGGGARHRGIFRRGAGRAPGAAAGRPCPSSGARAAPSRRAADRTP